MVRKRDPPFLGKEGKVGGGSFLTDHASRLAPIQVGTLSKTEWPQGCSPLSSEICWGCRPRACPRDSTCAPRGCREDGRVICVISVICVITAVHLTPRPPSHMGRGRKPVVSEAGVRQDNRKGANHCAEGRAEQRLFYCGRYLFYPSRQLLGPADILRLRVADRLISPSFGKIDPSCCRSSEYSAR